MSFSILLNFSLAFLFAISNFPTTCDHCIESLCNYILTRIRPKDSYTYGEYPPVSPLILFQLQDLATSLGAIVHNQDEFLAKLALFNIQFSIRDLTTFRLHMLYARLTISNETQKDVIDDWFFRREPHLINDANPMQAFVHELRRQIISDREIIQTSTARFILTNIIRECITLWLVIFTVLATSFIFAYHHTRDTK